MRILLWITSAAALALWSLLAWAGHGLVPVLAGGLAVVPAWLSLDAGTTAALAGAVEWLVPFSEWAVVIVWALGALLIVAAPFALGRVARVARRATDNAAGTALTWLERRRVRAARSRLLLP